MPDDAKPGLMWTTKLRSRPPAVVSAVHVEPLSLDVTRWPVAYGLKSLKLPPEQLHVYAAVPLAKADASRKTSAYRVPAVSVTGLEKVIVFGPPAPPSLKPGSVAEARSAPVGTGVAPVVARMESVTFGLFAVHDAQKSSTSTRLSCPVTVGVTV